MGCVVRHGPPTDSGPAHHERGVSRGVWAEEAGLRPGPTKDRDATAGDLPGDGLPRLVPHDRKTGGSETPPLRKIATRMAEWRLVG